MCRLTWSHARLHSVTHKFRDAKQRSKRYISAAWGHINCLLCYGLPACLAGLCLFVLRSVVPRMWFSDKQTSAVFGCLLVTEREISEMEVSLMVTKREISKMEASLMNGCLPLFFFFSSLLLHRKRCTVSNAVNHLSPHGPVLGNGSLFPVGSP